MHPKLNQCPALGVCVNVRPREEFQNNGCIKVKASVSSLSHESQHLMDPFHPFRFIFSIVLAISIHSQRGPENGTRQCYGDADDDILCD